MISLVTGPHGTAAKGLEKRLSDLEVRGKIEIIKTTEDLKSA